MMMKKDNLERFIRDNREAFDDREPPRDLWQKLEAGLNAQAPGPASKPPRQPFQQVHRSALPARQQWFQPGGRVAAAVALLVLAGSFFYVNQRYGVSHQPEVVAASPVYAKEVVQYTRLIDNKRTELEQLTADNPALYQEFATDLNRLEHSYQSLKADLPQTPNQQVLIQAMIQNLQLQINLLNEQLRVIQRIKQQTHENPV